AAGPRGRPCAAAARPPRATVAAPRRPTTTTRQTMGQGACRSARARRRPGPAPTPSRGTRRRSIPPFGARGAARGRAEGATRAARRAPAPRWRASATPKRRLDRLACAVALDLREDRRQANELALRVERENLFDEAGLGRWNWEAPRERSAGLSRSLDGSRPVRIGGIDGRLAQLRAAPL